MAPENIKPLVENAKGVHVKLVECIAEIRVGEPKFSPVGLERTLIVQYTFLFLSFQCSQFTKCYGRWCCHYNRRNVVHCEVNFIIMSQGIRPILNNLNATCIVSSNFLENLTRPLNCPDELEQAAASLTEPIKMVFYQ